MNLKCDCMSVYVVCLTLNGLNNMDMPPPHRKPFLMTKLYANITNNNSIFVVSCVYL